MDVDDEPVDLDMQKKFFDVGPFDRSQVDLNKPATTVEEYLKQVIVDRERQPQVAVARNLSEIMPKIKESAQKSKEYVRKQMEMYDGPSTAATNGSTSNETMSSSRSRFVPDNEWCQAKVNEFSHNRSLLEARKAPSLLMKDLKVPPVGDSMAWCQVCFERRLEGLEISEDLAEHFAHHKGTPPTVGLIKSLNEIQVNCLVAHQAEYISERGYTRATLEWIYSLLLVVKKPLPHEVCAALRQFCRRCREWRTELDEDEMDTIYELSWFIAIISIYFAQRDLAD